MSYSIFHYLNYNTYLMCATWEQNIRIESLIPGSVNVKFIDSGLRDLTGSLLDQISIIFNVT